MREPSDDCAAVACTHTASGLPVVRFPVSMIVNCGDSNGWRIAMPVPSSHPNRRDTRAASVAAGALNMPSAGGPEAAEGDAIRPFHFMAPEEDLADLRRRLMQTRLPDKEPVSDYTQGVPLKTIEQVLRYWRDHYDWRKVEARLNSYPQFITEIDGLDIHFIHVRSKEKNALPVIVTHGWPGSI